MSSMMEYSQLVDSGEHGASHASSERGESMSGEALMGVIDDKLERLDESTDERGVRGGPLNTAAWLRFQNWRSICINCISTTRMRSLTHFSIPFHRSSS